jgi:molybdenum-dependent DNA-binding transcriptional regulator ModE
MATLTGMREIDGAAKSDSLCQDGALVEALVSVMRGRRQGVTSLCTSIMQEYIEEYHAMLHLSTRMTSAE